LKYLKEKINKLYVNYLKNPTKQNEEIKGKTFEAIWKEMEKRIKLNVMTPDNQNNANEYLRIIELMQAWTPEKK